MQDVLLLERNKLPCGTTWDSAAQVRQLRSSENLTRLIRDGAELYARPEAETGRGISCDAIPTQSSGRLGDLFNSFKQRVTRKARSTTGHCCAARAGTPCTKASKN